MQDYRKKIIDGVLNHPMYKQASEELPQDQKENIEKVLAEFVDNFSMNFIRTISVAQLRPDAQKMPDNMSGSLIIPEDGG